METSNWRSQLQADSRQRIITRVMDAMKNHHIQVSGDDGLQDFEKIAVSFEEEVYTIATSQSEYMRKICFKLLTLETTSQNHMPIANTVNPSYTALLDSTIGEDWQEEVHKKIKAIKDLYLLDLNDLHQKVLGKLQQYDSLSQQVNNERIEKMKVFKNMLERFMAFLQIPKHHLLPIYKDKLSTYEKVIVDVITSSRRKLAPNQ